MTKNELLKLKNIFNLYSGEVQIKLLGFLY